MEKIKENMPKYSLSQSLSFRDKYPIHIPLFDDLKSQKRILLAFSIKLVAFLLLFLLFDLLAGNLLRMGLDRYFGLDHPASVLCIGHSHTVLGIDKIALEKQLNLPVAKYARQGADISNRLAMIRHYLEVQPDSVKVIVYDVDAHTFTGEGLSANSHQLFYPFIDTPVIRDYVKATYSSSQEYWLRQYLKLPRFSEVTLAFSIRGWLEKWTNLKHGEADIKRLRKELAQGDFRKIAFDPEPVKLFEETVRLIRSRGIHLVLTYIPTIDVFNDAEPEKYQESIRRFKSYAENDGGITFLNYNTEFSHRHKLFYDPIHLNIKGQKLVTQRLAKDLEKLIQDRGLE